MGEDDRGPTVTTKPADKWADAVFEPVKPDIATSPEVVKILQEQGVEAAQEWIASQQGQ